MTEYRCQLSEQDINELRYCAKYHHGYFWFGPESRGEPPMHETYEPVARYVRLGFLKHVPGRGYVVTEKCKTL
jgi:hypothetical protein